MKKKLFVLFLIAAVFSGIPVFSYAETRLASRDTNKLAQDWMPCTVSDPAQCSFKSERKSYCQIKKRNSR
jgi:hypothetical protein